MDNRKSKPGNSNEEKDTKKFELGNEEEWPVLSPDLYSGPKKKRDVEALPSQDGIRDDPSNPQSSMSSTTSRLAVDDAESSMSSTTSRLAVDDTGSAPLDVTIHQSNPQSSMSSTNSRLAVDDTGSTPPDEFQSSIPQSRMSSTNSRLAVDDTGSASLGPPLSSDPLSCTSSTSNSMPAVDTLSGLPSQEGDIPNDQGIEWPIWSPEDDGIMSQPPSLTNEAQLMQAFGERVSKTLYGPTPTQHKRLPAIVELTECTDK